MLQAIGDGSLRLRCAGKAKAAKLSKAAKGAAAAA